MAQERNAAEPQPGGSVARLPMQKGSAPLWQAVAVVASATGLGLALAAFVLDGTGVTGSPGAFLAILGTVAALLGLLMLGSLRLSRGVARGLVVLTLLAAGLTALAGWFLMQHALTLAMALAFAATPLAAMFSPPFRRI